MIRVFIASIKHHDQNATWGRKGLFCLQFYITVLHRRKAAQGLKQSMSLEAGADPEARRSPIYWLVLHSLLIQLSYNTRDHQPRDSTDWSKLGSPTLIINQ